MMLLILGLAMFFLVHLVPTQPDIRSGVVGRFGENGYKGIFSIISLIGLVLIVVGFGKLQAMPGKNPILWSPPVWSRHLAFTLMLPAMILLVAAYVPSRIRSAVRHPMLAAIKLWALSHLFANGDLASLLLFGSFLAFGIFDRISVKRRGVPRPAPATSAINDIFVVAVGLGLYAIMLTFGHARLIGIPLLPGWH